MSLADRLEQALGKRPSSVRHLSGGHVGDIFLAEFPQRGRAVVKTDATNSPNLGLEGRMLRDLAARRIVPVPSVWHVEPSLLVMDFIESGRVSGSSEEHAADLLAALHSVKAPQYGYDYDTLIGGLQQPNAWMDRWPQFFIERRVLPMARLAGQFERRIEKLGAGIDRWLPTSNPPGLIHGDVWSGNVLAHGDRVVGLIDPALSFSDPEIELAFITLFGTFGERFFHRYREHRALSPDFFETRRDLYNLYPLLVHVCLFGGSYVGQVDGTLKRFGY